MSVRDLLAREAAAWSPREEFTLVGAPALVVTNETTPTGFYDELRRTAHLDGYVLGPGCGNVLAMIEGFAAPPRGMVMVDVDPAVVCAGRMLVACLARQESLEDFVRAFFCGGEATLANLEQEVLATADSAVQRRRMAAQHARLWQGLAVVTEDFRHRPQDVAAWLERWQQWDRAAGAPVRTSVANHHGLLQTLARRGDIAVLEASLFDPALLTAMAALPGFAPSQNLVYLSNAADHVLRREVFAGARAKLRLGPQSAAADAFPRSTAEFLAYVNEQHLAHLHAVAGRERPTCFVYSTTRNELTLRATASVPRYGPEDLELGADLEEAVRGFFGGATLDSGQAVPASGEGWERAESLRARALGLYAAGVAGDPAQRAAALADLAREPGWRELPAAATDYLTFWTAEVSYAALAVADAGFAGNATWTAMLESLGQVASHLLQQGPLSSVPTPLSSAACLLPLTRAAALALSGRLLRQEPIESAGLATLSQLALPDSERESQPWGGWESEALLRLVSIHAQLSLRGWDAAMEALSCRIRSAVAASGEISLPPQLAGAGTTAVEPYLAFATRPGVLVDSTRWALLLQGLLGDDTEPILTALRVTYRARHGAAIGETHVLVDRMLAAGETEGGG